MRQTLSMKSSTWPDDVAGESEECPTSTTLRKLAVALGELATYVTNNVSHFVNYGERFRAGERISTGFVESAINQIVDKRWISASRCVGRRAVPTYYSRPEPAFSTATLRYSSGAAIPPSDRPQPTTMPPLCDGFQVRYHPADSRCSRPANRDALIPVVRRAASCHHDEDLFLEQMSVPSRRRASGTRCLDDKADRNAFHRPSNISHVCGK